MRVLELNDFIEIRNDIDKLEAVCGCRSVNFRDTFEKIVRILAEEEDFGVKMSFNYVNVTSKIKNMNICINDVREILLSLAIRHPSIFESERMRIGFTYFWIKADRDTFEEWFETFFGKRFKE